MAILQAKQLSKRYNSTVALNNLDLSIGRGEIFCLLGQNGAGKTTTINLFLGFTKPSKGTAKINGVTVGQNAGETTKFIAYIPEVVQLYKNLTGLENLDYFSRLAGFKYTPEELGEFLNQVGLQAEAYQKRLSGFSKGMRQKVGIAIALAKKAEVIFMDEPTSGLDPIATAEFTKVCKGLAAGGTTIFMATHDIFNAVNVGTRIGIMNRGRLTHSIDTGNITVNELQQLYLQTI